MVYSELGKGATFKIYLPVAAAATEAPVPARDTQALRGTETVLVVEDQAEVRGLIEKTLSRYGYTVITATNGPEATARAQAYEGPIHVMLTDVILPGASGREIARQLAADRPQLRVLYMSGYTDDVIVQHGVLERAWRSYKSRLRPTPWRNAFARCWRPTRLPIPEGQKRRSGPTTPRHPPSFRHRA